MKELTEMMVYDKAVGDQA